MEVHAPRLNGASVLGRPTFSPTLTAFFTQAFASREDSAEVLAGHTIACTRWISERKVGGPSTDTLVGVLASRVP